MSCVSNRETQTVGRGGWVAAAGDLLLGASCPGCESPGWGLCVRCHRSVAGIAYLTRPDPCPPGFPTTATAGPYGTIMSRLISGHKEQQVLTLTSFLGGRLAVAVTRLAEERLLRPAAPLVLVPVPSSPAAVRARGFDATWSMARVAARSRPGGHPTSVRRLLSHARRVQDQTELGATGRRENLTGSLRVSGRGVPSACLVVIVDDLVTTGSSLTEAARALQAARIAVLGAATVAATVRSSPSGRTQRRPA